MRRVRLWVVLVLALSSGGLAGYLAFSYIRQKATPLIAAEPRRNRIAVAARDLEVGSIIRAEDVRVIDWPGDALPPGYASSASEVVGRGVITPVKVNEPLLASKLADKEAGGGLPIVIPEGMRALSVRVDEVIAVAGFVGPGTRVDVLLTFNPGGEGNEVSRILLQNVPVLARGQQIQTDPEGKPQVVSVVTLLVTPEQAELLTLAASQGRIQLALRNTLDTDSADTEGARIASLLGRPIPRPRPPGRVVSVGRPQTAPDSLIVETYKGGARTLIKF